MTPCLPLLSLPPRVYIVMEYIPSVLSSIIKEHVATGLPRELFWDLLKQLLLGVRWLHKQQVRSEEAHEWIRKEQGGRWQGRLITHRLLPREPSFADSIYVKFHPLL